MEVEVGLDRVLGCGSDKGVERRPYRCAAARVDARRGQGGRLGLDADSEVDHVENVVMRTDGRGFDGERCRLGHRQHERPTALECLDEALGP